MSEILIKINRNLGTCYYCDGSGKASIHGVLTGGRCEPCVGSGQHWEEQEISLVELLEETGLKVQHED